VIRSLIMASMCVLMTEFSAALARDFGQWDNTDSEVSEWFRSLMQPDDPMVPCCGKADAYWCDIIYVRDGKTFCQITDDRDDDALMRPHHPIGEEIEIPDSKLKWDRGNPTGHAVVFLSGNGIVYCFVQGTGI
jgi:hypothetical protein